MFKIESYVTPILLSYVDKYVRDFKPADAQVSLWGGGVALHNLVLKADVLQQEVSLPFTLVSGRIHELLIQVPWTKIMSEPIVVTIDTIECVLSLNRPTAGTSDDTPAQESPSRKTQVVEAPPGYMQALVRRIVSNIALRVHHLIVKYVQDDIVMSLNVKHLAVDSAGPDWQSAFADIDQAQPVIRRLMRLDDLTLCLDRADADGKIRFYQEPLLYRCQLDFRILTRLVSANTRRATCLSIQLRSTKLAWGVTGDQLTLLLRLVRERGMPVKPPTPSPKSTTIQTPNLHIASANSAEPARSESWSEWAWSWLPTWTDKDGGTAEAPLPPTPVPVHFAAYFDDVNFVFKTLETEGTGRKRARGVLELNAYKTAFKSSFCHPTTIRMRLGMRELTLLSRGKCVCGFLDYNGAQDEPTMYLCKKVAENQEEEEWQWPDDPMTQLVEPAVAAEEVFRGTPTELQEPVEPMHDVVPAGISIQDITRHDNDEFWQEMAPQLSVEYIHERSPPSVNTNPYENPPFDFQYSDWVEECDMKIRLEPVEIRVCMGLLHRLSTIGAILKDLPPSHAPDLPMRTLTVEECEALSENLPQRRISIEVQGLHVQVHPWDHSSSERASASLLLLDIDLPKNSIAINGPLYPHRVCSAACQMPEEDNAALWQGTRLHITLNITSIQAKICSTRDCVGRPCARADLRAVAHVLLNQNYFNKRENVTFAYSVKIREANVCGSAARLTAALEVISSLYSKHVSTTLKYSTLASDALRDEEAVAIDLTFEELTGRGYLTKTTNTHILALQTTKATALHEIKDNEPRQAWLFSAPDAPSSTPCLRVAVQWCNIHEPGTLDYIGIWTEPTAIAVDPLFIAWLAYKPVLKPLDSLTSLFTMKCLSSHYLPRRRTPPASSSGRGGTRSGSGAEVHGRTRSFGSSEKGESNIKRTHQQGKAPSNSFFGSGNIIAFHERLRKMLVNIELGLAMVYVTMSTACALDCATVRDAMERHASLSHRVTAISLGRLAMCSSSTNRQLWQDVRHDGPTFLLPNKDEKYESLPDSFPWKMRLADVSCQTLELYVADVASSSRLRSQLKSSGLATPRTVVEPFTTTVTLSVVTKSVQIKYLKHENTAKKDKEPNTEESRVKYFKTGMDFKPTTLKEFVRGPASRKKEKSPEILVKEDSVKEIITDGPVVSLGIHLHADTPPLTIKLEYNQLQVISATIHCFTHIVTLLQRPPLLVPKSTSASIASLNAQRSQIRSLSELDEQNTGSEETPSENRSELISIFEASVRDTPSFKMKTFFWFQWVVSHVTLVAATSQVKLAFDVDDVICTIDLQTHYNQLKVKVASASVRHYSKTDNDEWTAGALRGRVLEAREPANAKEENHFLAITVTQAQISNLPASWKEELHPKLLERKSSADSMWEIYATLAPLEAVLQPQVLEHITSLVLEMAPRASCPLKHEKKVVSRDWEWPFCYVTAGGIRLLLTVEENDTEADDTFMFVIGKMTVNPHPENPICRRTINTSGEAGWPLSPTVTEGRQYELLARNVAVRCAQFKQLVNEETSETQMQGTASENPALKWTQQVVRPSITPVLHAVDIGCVLAPALYVNGVLNCGPAVELNLVSDCSLEIALDQLVMAQKVVRNITSVIREREEEARPLGDEKHGYCPYATLLRRDNDEYLSDLSSSTATDENVRSPPEMQRSSTVDSGVETVTSSTTRQNEPPSTVKKSVSVAFLDQVTDASEYLEVFVTMGMIELSLYTADDCSPKIEKLRPPQKWMKDPPVEPAVTLLIKERDSETESDSESPDIKTSVKSITDRARDADVGHSKLEVGNVYPYARKTVGNLPLLHATFHQPNLYYWRKKAQKNIQVSFFNVWLGLGAGETDDSWHAVLLSTAQGAADPITDIPPALATVKVVVPSAASPSASSAAVRGTIRLDVERPVMLELSSDRLRRLKNIFALIHTRMALPLEEADRESCRNPADLPPLYQLRRLLVNHGMESVTVVTTQIGVCGSRGAAGWDALTVQLAAGGRPDRLVCRSLVSGAVISSGPPGDARHVVLQPLMIGLELEANWEAWRRAECGLSSREPSVRVCVDLDCITLDLRPGDLEAVAAITHTIEEVMRPEPDLVNTTEVDIEDTFPQKSSLHDRSSPPYCHEPRLSLGSMIDPSDEHFYKDDLRSGAFKIVSGGQLPMAYQVTLHNNAVSWRYPHPRAITRLIVFPLPDRDEETECVLELYSQLLGRWEQFTRFFIPVGDLKEVHLYVPSPDAVHSVMWRIRVYEGDINTPPFEFDIKRFLSRTDPLVYEASADPLIPKPACGVTAEQLSGVIRVDSCFSPRLMPRVRVVGRLVQLCLNLHNALPVLPNCTQSAPLEGYYLSKPLMRSHRVLSLCGRNATLHAHIASPAGALLLLNTSIASDIVECATGTMEQFVAEFRVRAGASLPAGAASRARAALSSVRVSLHVPRLRTLQALVADWRDAIKIHILETIAEEEPEPHEMSNIEAIEHTVEALEGRVSLWIHNTCAVAMRVGQEGTKEVVPLGPGVLLAYRWQSPTAPKKLRFALAGPSTDWHWSNSIPFTEETFRVRLQDAENLGSMKARGGGVYLHTRVEDLGSRRCVTLAGRLCLHNMCRSNLLYKVRARCPDTSQWRTICSGELDGESIGRSVVCGAECEMALKIKITSKDVGWSGDIPLKECPKENVPWLVKVPMEGEMPYMSVWCRVVRARSDGRVLAAIWPLYVLYSHLPLDTDVLIETEKSASCEEGGAAPLVQAAAGRGRCTHLLAPGTTAARHSLSFQYRTIECPVTKEAVPLHYGVTDTSVFDKRSPVASLDEVVADTRLWLERSGRNAKSQWPYSVVAKHWPREWAPALLQPRCDVTVRYRPVRVGGGCSLEMQLCPVVLLCNAVPIALTLRAHDAAPLCKLEPGTAISPPSAVLKKPFFISVEMGRETFVSGELSVCGAELGRYGTPPPGRVALDRATELAVQCNHKVALLSMYYEIREDINILGITTTYMLINRLDNSLLVSAMAVPNEADEDVLRPNAFKIVAPVAKDSVHGRPLCRFWMVGNVWRGSDPKDLRLYLCITLPPGITSNRATPIRLGQAPVRRAIALSDSSGTSIPVVVTQVYQEGRWVVTVDHDPCPQLLVRNRTRTALAIAQPTRTDDEPTTSRTTVIPDCAGTRWHCVVGAGALTHYSTPHHSLRYPPPVTAPIQPTVTFLTLAKRGAEEGEPAWCAPVACADGEQLIQLPGGDTIKMRVRSHPHSTLLELRDVDQTDISASEIRKRLLVTSSVDDLADSKNETVIAKILERTDADEQLVEKPEKSDSASKITVSLPVPENCNLLGKELVAKDSPPKKSAKDYKAHMKEATESREPSTLVLFAARQSMEPDSKVNLAVQVDSIESTEAAIYHQVADTDWDETSSWAACDRLRLVATEVAVEFASVADTRPLIALHLDRAAVVVKSDLRRTKTIVSIADVQIDNLQYDTGQYDFAVVATTRGSPQPEHPWPPLWNIFADRGVFGTREAKARAVLKLTHDAWNISKYKYNELAEVEVRLGPLALYVEDAYVTSLAALCRAAGGPRAPPPPAALAESRALRSPLRLRALTVHPLDLTLTLHTAVRMYIALDQSPLRLSAFKLVDAMTSAERLTHALTVHYLSAAILGAGWVVGGLELLGAPGALAARVGGATGGVRGVASAAAAALLRSLSAWAGSLARNLDLLAGDEEHARRAAAARRRPPPSLLAGLATGITNFAINILGAVGGLAHHPLVGVAVGESESGAAGLRRGLLGALAKPLSATADLVAYAGHGLLTQTGWDPVPQPRVSWSVVDGSPDGGWRRDCVRWAFRMSELPVTAGFHVLMDGAPLLLLFTHKFLVIGDPDTERIIEMIDFKYCTIGVYQGQIIELEVAQRRSSKFHENQNATDEDDEIQVSAAAMARVARYTGAAAGGASEARVLCLLPAPGHALALHAALAVATHHNSHAHFALL